MPKDSEHKCLLENDLSAQAELCGWKEHQHLLTPQARLAEMQADLRQAQI
jgi:hypothetical protein